MADVSADDVKDTNEVVEQVDQDTTAAESSTEENDSFDMDETDGDELDADESDEAEADEDESSDESNAEETEAKDDKPKHNAEARKEQLNEDIRDLVSRRNALRQEVEAATAELYRAKTPQELVAEGMDETKAELESMRQEQALEKYTADVTQKTALVNEESLRVLRDFPVFDKESSDYDAEFAAEVEDAYKSVAGLQINKNGLIEDVRVTPYNFYKKFAKAREHGMKAAAPKAQRAAERQLAAADVMGTAPRKPANDPDMEAFDRAWDET